MSTPLCKAGLKKNIIKKEVFDREIKICKELYRRKRGCCWGKCEDCGVVFLLQKFHKGKLIDNKIRIKKLRNKIFKK